MKEKKKWLWEFSKKVVVWCVVLYFIGNIVSFAAIFCFEDLSALGTINDNLKEIMKTCVFGYFVKAGIENVLKIKLNVEKE